MQLVLISPLFSSRADELNRRKSREIPTKSATKMSVRNSPAVVSRSNLVNDTVDPVHLLSVWLGELDSLQKVNVLK